MHGAPDRRAVAAALPRRQVEVDAVLGQPGVGGVAVGAAGPASSAGGRSAVGGARRGGARRRPHRAGGHRAAARSAPHVAGVGPRQLERLGGGRGSGTAASSSADGAVAGGAGRGQHVWRSVALRRAARRSRSGLRCSDTTRWSTARVHATYSRRRRSASPICSSSGWNSSNSSLRCSASVHVRRRATRPTIAPVDRCSLGGQPGDDGDRELQALGRVHGHDPHRVVVVLGEDRVAGPALVGLVRGPAQVAAQAPPAGVGPRPGLVDDVADPPPHVAGVGPGERGLEHPPLDDERVEQVGRRRARRLARRSSAGGRAPRRRGGPSMPVGRGRRTGSSGRRRGASRSSSTSLQPYSGERSAATSASSSVGSAAARSASSRSRISGAR